MAIIPLFIIVLLNEISYQMVIPAMGHIVELTSPHGSLGLINTLYGAGIAIFTVTVMLGSPVMGYLSDKWGRKPVLAVSLGLMIISCLLFMISLYTKNIAYFLIARGLSGLGGASTAVVQAAIADSTQHKARAVNFSLIGLALTIGLIVGPLLGGIFIQGQDIRSHTLMIPFGVTAIVSSLNLILFFMLFEHKPLIKTKNQMNTETIPRPSKISQETLIYLGLFFLLEFSWSLYYLHLPLWLNTLFFYDPQKTSIYLSMMGISMCVGLLFYKIIALIIDNKKIIITFFGVFILSLILISLCKLTWLNWLMIMPISWSVALTYVAIMELISETMDKTHQGVLMGTLLTTMALAWTMTGFFVKFLFSMNFLMPIIISILGLVLGLIMLNFIPHKKASE